ncbi:phosphoribosylglycinamide formyltransferase [Oleispirillum naphthae]|uniref:phosphoribosylglycinamide formyltransferase n=1 Tax=Oleispirillum naphthae TaxID=2838853 RepID=UPI0030825AEE
MTARKLRLGVLISGKGSNLQALIDACADPAFPAEIGIVVSNVARAPGLARAAAAGLPAAVIDHAGFAGREPFEEALTATLASARVDLVCLAGFMRLLTPGFVNRWNDRLINIHPSLLPAYKGLRTHERALADGARFSGCTVHFVRPDMDAGPIIIQAAVPTLPADTPEDLAARIRLSEHIIYPEAVRLIAEGRVHIAGNRTTIDGFDTPPDAAVNPPPGA